MGSSSSANSDVFIGNPFQAPIDMGSLLGSTNTNTNMKSNVMYIWDPTLNTRGAYVTVSLPSGSNSTGSGANQYLMPGQAAFIKTNSSGAASFTFDNAAVTDVDRVSTFRTERDFQEMRIQLFQKDSLDHNGPVADGVIMHFSNSYSSDYNEWDATKPGNLDENISIINGGSYYSIDLRNFPISEEKIQLNINRYRHKDYSLVIDATQLKDADALLVDHYKNISTQVIANSKTRYDYSLDGSSESSLSTRFELVLNPKTSSTYLKEGINKFKVYPNPSSDGIIHLEGNTDADLIQLYDVFGRSIDIEIIEVEKGHFLVNSNPN